MPVTLDILKRKHHRATAAFDLLGYVEGGTFRGHSVRWSDTFKAAIEAERQRVAEEIEALNQQWDALEHGGAA